MKHPSGWQLVEFSQLAAPMAARPDFSAATRCIELEHIGQGNGRLLGWRELQPEEVSKIAFRKGDVLFAKLRPYLKKAWVAEFDGICSSEFWSLRADSHVCNSRFLKQFLLSEQFSRATFIATGSKMPRADWTLIAGYPFAIPPHSEQQRIAEILDAADETIEKIDVLLAAKERRKRALMQQLLFAKMRLRGYSNPWKTRTLGELLSPVTRIVSKPQGSFMAAGIRSHGKGVFLKPNFDPEDIALDELFEIRTDDLIVNITFAWEGAAAIVPAPANGALVSHRFPTFRVNEENAALPFLRHYILTKRFVFDCGLASPGGAGRNRVLSKSAFLDMELCVPDAAEQSAIGEILDDTDAELANLRDQRVALDQQKRGLMQQLLTGKRRVKVA